MSRIGHKIIKIPDSVQVAVADDTVTVKGPKGELSCPVLNAISVELEEGCVKVSRKNDDKKTRSLHGLNRMLIANMVEGVSRGYTKELQIEGVGFKGAVQGNKATFHLGFSSPKEMAVPDGIILKIEDGVNIIVSGADKQKVGDFAARIKRLCPAEPYKGKGVRFKGEYIRRKAGKTVA